MSLHSENSAIVGLGLIGTQWAHHLETDGVLGGTWNRTPKHFVRFKENIRDIPESSRIIHVVVSDEVAAREITETLAAKLTKHHIIIQSTTIDPRTSSILRKMVEAVGAYYVEAPFTGSLPAAEQRKTVFFLGCEESVKIKKGDVFEINEKYQAVRSHLSRLSSVIFDIGSNEQACVIKLSMNLLIAAQMVALAEAYSTCLGHEIDKSTFFEVLKANAANSGVAQLKEQKLRDNDFSPQFSIKHMQKDMRLFATLGKELNLHETVLEYLSQSVQVGLGEDDISALFRLIHESL